MLEPGEDLDGLCSALIGQAVGGVHSVRGAGWLRWGARRPVGLSRASLQTHQRRAGVLKRGLLHNEFMNNIQLPKVSLFLLPFQTRS